MSKQQLFSSPKNEKYLITSIVKIKIAIFPFKVVVLLSMEEQKFLRFPQKRKSDLHLCSEDKQKSYRFGTTQG